MKRFIYMFILFVPALLMAQVHYAKLEPVETFQIKAAAAGQVLQAHDEMEGKTARNGVVVQIDDRVDRAQKRALETSLKVYKQTLDLTRRMRQNQESVYQRESDYYQRIKNLKTKSKTEKDRVFNSMIAAKNQLLTLDEKIATLTKQIADATYQVTMLEDRIEKKSVRVPGLYIYKVAVRRGDYVNPGSPLLTAMDLSAGRLVVYLDAQEVENLDRKTIYIDGEPTKLTFSKVIKVADEVHISAYRAEIVIPSPQRRFSSLLKVEVKEDAE
jgi:multidrug resistance efflux pump